MSLVVVVGTPTAAEAVRTTVLVDEEEEEDGSLSSLASTPLSPYDVLCGRSSLALNSVGNRRFRVTVALALPRYLSAHTRAGRTAAIDAVVASVRASGGRFLRRHGSSSNSRWVELDAKQAREKVGHALRDMCSSTSRDVHDQEAADGPGSRGARPPTALHNLRHSPGSSRRLARFRPGERPGREKPSPLPPLRRPVAKWGWDVTPPTTPSSPSSMNTSTRPGPRDILDNVDDEYDRGDLDDDDDDIDEGFDGDMDDNDDDGWEWDSWDRLWAAAAAATEGAAQVASV
jgi:hypothetical protein